MIKHINLLDYEPVDFYGIYTNGIERNDFLLKAKKYKDGVKIVRESYL